MFPTSYSWSDSPQPIRTMFEALGCSLDDYVSISYFNATGVWNTRHTRVKYADSFAKSLENDATNVYVMVNEVTAKPGSGRGDA